MQLSHSYSTWISVVSYRSERNAANKFLWGVDAFGLRCDITLSVLDERTVELLQSVDDSPHEPEDNIGRVAKLRLAWKEDEMKELLR